MVSKQTMVRLYRIMLIGECVVILDVVVRSDSSCVVCRSKLSDGRTGPGPSLFEAQIAREKIHRFDHEKIPERVAHA